MFQQIKDSLLKIGNFSPEELDILFSRLKHRTIAKNDCLIREGQVSQDFYFINAGAFRHYTIEESGDEATLNLFIPSDWVFEYKSFVSQQPSANLIQAVSDSEVLGLSIWEFHQLARLSERFFQVARILELAVQNLDYQRLSPEQKYELLLNSKPELLHHFPLKHIASYLGMKPETLSRIRKKISS